MKIFISYNHQDIFAAKIIEQWLHDSGLKPLRDESTFLPKAIDEEIIKAVAECDLFLVILSSNFYESKWTRDELGQARALKKKILFIAIAEYLPEGPDQQRIPLELWRRPTSTWYREVIGAVRQFQNETQADKPALDQWFSKHLECNQWVKERVGYENLAYNRLHVASTVELASKLNGWKLGEIRVKNAGDYKLEQEVLRSLPPEVAFSVFSEMDNYALKTLREDLSDEPWLGIDLQRISHNLVRVVADNFDSIDRGRSPRNHLFEHANIPYPHSVVVHMTLVTSDNYLLIGHRSSRPRFYENCWSISYEEHMRPSEDDADPFNSAIRGLKEELIGKKDRYAITDDSIRFFSLFRELDNWTNEEKQESFWDINVGLAGLIRVPHTIDAVFRAWLNFPEDKREFRHLAAIPYTFDNIINLLESRSFDPRNFKTTLLAPSGLDTSFPDFVDKPLWKRWHPTTKIRLVRCLTSDEFLRAIEAKVVLER